MSQVIGQVWREVVGCRNWPVMWVPQFIALQRNDYIDPQEMISPLSDPEPQLQYSTAGTWRQCPDPWHPSSTSPTPHYQNQNPSSNAATWQECPDQTCHFSVWTRRCPFFTPLLCVVSVFSIISVFYSFLWKNINLHKTSLKSTFKRVWCQFMAHSQDFRHCSTSSNPKM